MSPTVHYVDTGLLDRPVRRPAPVAVEPGPSAWSSARASVAQLAAHRTTWLVLLGVAALTTRLVGLPTAYDVFIDETSYTDIALNVAHGHGVTLYGLPFVLHPPGAFYLYGLVIRVFGLHGGVESTLFSLRQLDAVLGAATCVVTFLLVDRVARRETAVVAAALMAVDPLAISFDSRVMLEAPAQLATVTMFFCIASADVVRDSTFKRKNLLALAGLAGGTALATKETFGLVVLLSLLALLVSGWIATRREILRVTLISLIVYAVSIFADASHFGLKVWWNAKVIGILRVIGAHQNSGFNAPQTHVSIVSRMTADAGVLAVTYLLLAAGACCALGLLWRLEPWYPKRLVNDPKRRAASMCALWTVVAAAYLAYATVFGTIEEQMYYILLLPAVVSVCVWCEALVATPGRRRRAVTVAIAAALLFDVAVWTSTHYGHDDEYRQLVSWEAVHVAPHAVVSSTDGVSQFLLPRGTIGQWSTVAQLRRHHVDYVVLATLLVDQGYGSAAPSFARTVETTGHLVFEANGVSDGSLRVYDVRPLTTPAR
jgi:4-amino-4-deoxy-L-arabinose transferase-like glycosyltransferase